MAISTVNINKYYHYLHSENYIFTGHRHKEIELNILLSGEMEITCSGNIYKITKNQLLIIPPYMFHQNRVVGKENAELIVIHFTSFDLNNTGIIYKSIMQEETKSILKLLDDNIKNYGVFDSYGELVSHSEDAKKLFEVFFSYASNNFSTPSTENNNGDAYFYSKAVSYMYDNITKCPTVNDFLKETGIGKTTLSRIFKHYTGRGCMAFFNELKLDYAKKLLHDGENCKSVSNMLGYTSQSYFSRAFKQLYGYPPSEIK